MSIHKCFHNLSSDNQGSIAGINLGRIVKVLDCDLADFTYCTRDSAILTVAEMAVGVIVACIPTLGPIVFPHRRHGASARNPYADKNGNTSGSGAHIRLRGYRNDSFNDGSLQRLERDEINETHSLDYGEAKAHTFIHADTSKSADPTYGSSNNIEVRSVIEITKNLQSK